MIAIYIFVGAILLVFGTILFYNIRNKMKNAPKQDKPKQKKAPKPKKEKKKESKEPKTKPEISQKDAFTRPSDIARRQQALRREKEEQQRLELEKKLAEEQAKQIEEQKRLDEERKKREEIESQMPKKAGEGESTNRDYEMYGDRPLTESLDDPDVEIIPPSISEEIKNLSPEMKALLFGDILKKNKNS